MLTTPSSSTPGVWVSGITPRQPYYKLWKRRRIVSSDKTKTDQTGQSASRWESPEDTFKYNSTITALLISLLPNLTNLRFFTVERKLGTQRGGPSYTERPYPLAHFLEANNSLVVCDESGHTKFPFSCAILS